GRLIPRTMNGAPKWRNWQTRRTQNPVPFGEGGFDSHLLHYVFLGCPGARRLRASGWEVIGVREGWRGLVEGKLEQLGPREVSGILPRGGTIIGTSRTNPYKLDGGVDAVLRTFEESSFAALVT